MKDFLGQMSISKNDEKKMMANQSGSLVVWWSACQTNSSALYPTFEALSSPDVGNSRNCYDIPGKSPDFIWTAECAACGVVAERGYGSVADYYATNAVSYSMVPTTYTTTPLIWRR
jgi:hypothetical protein